MNFFLPMTPATTGPVPMPMRQLDVLAAPLAYARTRSSISRDMFGDRVGVVHLRAGLDAGAAM